MNKKKIDDLEKVSLNVREKIIKMSTDGGCFIGASLSCVDLIVYLYKEVLNLNNKNLDDDKRDYLLLSKGHDVPALYGTFSEIGILKPERLKNHLHTTDHIYWHPNSNVPGVEFHSGSLGHLPSVSAGIAYDIKLNRENNRVFVITGDGELDEGSVWETVLVASSLKLDNLIIIVDRNNFQANIETEKLIPLEPLEDKFRSFGCSVQRIDGHNFLDLQKVFSKIPFQKNKVNVVICDTIRGKGLPSIEARADRWFVNFTKDEVDDLIKELHGESKAKLKSKTLTVR